MDTRENTSRTRQRLIVVGNGMAGARLIDDVSRRAPGRYEIVALGAEATPAYNRVLLSAVLAGDKLMPEIALRPPGDARHVQVLTSEPVTWLDPPHHRLRTASGRTLAYDMLVLATGSVPIVPQVPGAHLPGIVTFRAASDAEQMIAAARPGRRAVVIGGGLLGLEAAEGLRRRGMAVTVVHLMPWLMERQLDARAGGLLRRTLERRGLVFVLPAETAEIVGRTQVESVRLGNGLQLPTDLVVMAVGTRPNIELAQRAGLACSTGIVVDDGLRTSDAAIYAVGECIEHRRRCYGLLAPLWEQVEVCAARLGGDSSARYLGSDVATSLKVAGVDVYSAGELPRPGDEEIVLADPGREIYRKLVVRDGRLGGVVLYGAVEDGPWYLEVIKGRRPIAPCRADLAFGRGGAGVAGTPPPHEIAAVA